MNVSCHKMNVNNKRILFDVVEKVYNDHEQFVDLQIIGHALLDDSLDNPISGTRDETKHLD